MATNFIAEAFNFIKQGRYEKALLCYEQFSKRYHEHAPLARANIEYCKNRLRWARKEESIGSSSLATALQNAFGIDKIYVISLASRLDRRIRMLREMNNHGLQVTMVEAVDGSNNEAQKAFNSFQTRTPDIYSFSDMHIPKEIKQFWKKDLTPNVFGYLLSQKYILEDAMQKKYEKILVFDDDVFFHQNAENLIYKIANTIPDDFKIILLGASEYSNKKSKYFLDYTLNNSIYNPIPGYTCGSFAVIYDKHIYNEVHFNIKENIGPFDNAVLGSSYLKHKNKCFVFSEAVCIPDVQDSNIREKREQREHSLKMNWNISRYDEYKAVFTISIVLQEDMKIAEAMKDKLKTAALEIHFHFLRETATGFQEITEDAPQHDYHVFPPLTVPALQAQKNLLINKVASDIILAWPRGKKITQNEILAITTKAMYAGNQQARSMGTIDEIAYVLR